MTDWFAELRPQDGAALVECNFFDYLNNHPLNRVAVPPSEAFDKAIGIGNEFLAKMKREHMGKKVHFDVFYNEQAITGRGDPQSRKAYLGLTWAYNPQAKRPEEVSRGMFWSMYSEHLLPHVPFVDKVKKDLLVYLSH